jgi:hypothetical protein
MRSAAPARSNQKKIPQNPTILSTNFKFYKVNFENFTANRRGHPEPFVTCSICSINAASVRSAARSSFCAFLRDAFSVGGKNDSNRRRPSTVLTACLCCRCSLASSSSDAVGDAAGVGTAVATVAAGVAGAGRAAAARGCERGARRLVVALAKVVDRHQCEARVLAVGVDVGVERAHPPAVRLALLHHRNHVALGKRELVVVLRHIRPLGEQKRAHERRRRRRSRRWRRSGAAARAWRRFWPLERTRERRFASLPATGSV